MLVVSPARHPHVGRLTRTDRCTTLVGPLVKVMPNRFISLFSRPSTTPAPEGGSRAHHTRLRRQRNRLLSAGAILAVGAIVGTGFAVQAASSAQAEEYTRVKASARLSASTGLHAEQLSSHSGILNARAEKTATDALAAAKSVTDAAAGKVDAAALTAPVAQLSQHEFLAPQRIEVLAADITAKLPAIQAAIAAFDQAAAAKAAEEAAAAEAAAQAVPASSSVSRPSAPSDPSAAQAYARDYMAANYGWGADQFGCLVSLWDRESGWNANAYNSSSGAGGIPQALPASKMASAGDDWATNADTQVRWGLGYIASRWGNPCAAWDHSESSGWY